MLKNTLRPLEKQLACEYGSTQDSPWWVNQVQIQYVYKLLASLFLNTWLMLNTSMSTLCMSLLSSDLSSAALGFRKRLIQVCLPAVGVKVSLQACASNRCFLHPQPLPHIWTQCKRSMEVIICRAETRHLHRIWSHEVLYFFCVVKRIGYIKINNFCIYSPVCHSSFIIIKVLYFSLHTLFHNIYTCI